MRSTLVLSFAAVAFAAPASLSEWGHSITRWGAWFEGIADPQLVLGSSVKTVEDSRSIYDMLKASNEFTRLIKLVDLNDEIVDKLKNDKEITFFAPNNDAMPQHGEMLDSYSDEGDDDKDRLRKWKEVVREAMLYNMLPKELEWTELANNSTIATELHAEDGSFGGRRRRIKVEASTIPPSLTINNFVKIVASYRAKNGVVHVVNHPIYPPPDIMDELYLFPKMFSAAAIAFVKTDLEKELEFNSDNSKHNKHRDQWPLPGHHSNNKGHSGYGATTVFIPTNDAFNKLPNDLVTYLFSPFGERTLRKLMEFHTIPDYVLYTEWIQHIKTDDNNGETKRRGRYDAYDEDWEIHVTQEFPTLSRQKLPVQIDKTKSRIPGVGGFNWNFKVHGIDVENRDNVAQNGAVHVIGTVLCPRHQGATDAGKDSNDWNEWQKWLIEWARDN